MGAPARCHELKRFIFGEDALLKVGVDLVFSPYIETIFFWISFLETPLCSATRRSVLVPRNPIHENQETSLSFFDVRSFDTIGSLGVFFLQTINFQISFRETSFLPNALAAGHVPRNLYMKFQKLPLTYFDFPSLEK